MKSVKEPITIDEIVRRWKTEFDKHKTFNLYIDVPFCISVCKFCNLGRFQTCVNSEEYKEYFNKTLPKFFEEQYEILRLKTFDTLYFGGGTSGMMDTKTMKKVFGMIPDIEYIKSKKFEANPTLLSDEKLKILKEYGFNQISLGVQTFDEELIRLNNRIPVKIEKLQHIIEFCNSNGISVNCDILTFTEQSAYNSKKSISKRDFIIDINESLKNTSNDLRIMIEEVKPDTITVYPKWEMFSYSEENGFENGFTNIDLDLKYKINRTVLKIMRKYDGYKPVSDDNLNLNIVDREQSYSTNNIQLVKKDSKNLMVDKYDSSSYPFNKGNHQNVVGLGGYGGEEGRNPYSYIGNTLYYFNVVENGNIRYVQIKEEDTEGDNNGQ